MAQQFEANEYNATQTSNGQDFTKHIKYHLIRGKASLWKSCNMGYYTKDMKYHQRDCGYVELACIGPEITIDDIVKDNDIIEDDEIILIVQETKKQCLQLINMMGKSSQNEMIMMNIQSIGVATVKYFGYNYISIFANDCDIPKEAKKFEFIGENIGIVYQ